MRKRSLAGTAVTGVILGLLALPAPANAATSFAVTTALDSVDAAPGDGKCADAQGLCSLRAAILEANALPGPDTINLSAVVYVLTRAGFSENGGLTGDLDVTSPITIVGNGATVNAGDLDRAFDVLAGGALTLKDMTVTNGTAPTTQGMTPAESGGAIRSVATLTLDAVSVTNSVVTGTGASGGGIAAGGSLSIDRSTVSGNSATRAGGGIEITTGTVMIDRSTLSANMAGPTPGNGGALHVTGAARTTVDRSTVNANVASAEGGGLWNSSTGTMTVSRSVITDNEARGALADQGGGGLFNEATPDVNVPGGGTLIVDRTEITNNRATGAGGTGPTSGSGGGILNDQGTLSVVRSTITGNAAVRAGGGIEAKLGDTTLERTVLSNNSTGPTPGNGGGLHLTGAGTVTIERGTVVGNTATNEGGGLWNDANGTMRVTRTQISGNTAPKGANVFQQVPDGAFTIDGVKVAAGPNAL